MAQQRRTLVRWLLGGGFAASFASVVYPALRFMNPPEVSEASVNEVPAGKVQDLKPNAGKIVKFGSRPALLVRRGRRRVALLFRVCTHLNCTVQYQDSTRQIWCACHNGLLRPERESRFGPAAGAAGGIRRARARGRSGDVSPRLSAPRA